MAADNKEATPNEKAGSGAGSLASEPFGGGDITDEEGAAPKENLLASVFTPSGAITTGFVAVDGPK